MAFRIDRVVGEAAAAELVNRYRARLREQDLLPDSTALAVAHQAYLDGYVYVMARAGQVWVRSGAGVCEPERLRIVRVNNTCTGGHTALCQEPLGIFHVLPLSELAEHYVLESWPDPVNE